MGKMKGMKKWVFLFLICILGCLFHELPVKAAESEAVELKANVEDATQKNYFVYSAYSGKDWVRSESEAYIDLGGSDSKAEECFYEIHFSGNGITIYAAKAPAHGKVKYSIDGANEEVVDLYAKNRETVAVYSKSGLTEGDHVLKAVTLNEKSGSSIVNQVNYAEVTHLPYEGGEPSLGGTIEDANTQYTQSRYGEIAAKDKKTASLSAWKNDKAISEIVLFSKNCSLKNVRLTAGALTSTDGGLIGAEHVKTAFIKSAKAYNGRYLGYGDPNRAYPEATVANRSETSDILYQKGGAIDIAWNSLQPVWVEFDIPKDAKAGTYTGTLEASADGIEAPLQFTYQLTVYDVALPNAETYGDTFDIELWQYPYSSAEYYGVEPFSARHLELMKSSMLKYKEVGGHAITTTIVEEAWSGQTYSKNDVHYPSMVKWTKQSDGSFSYDYTDFDKWVAFCKDEIGIADKIVLYSIAPWHNSFTYWEDGNLKKEGFTAGSQRYVEVWTDFLTDLAGHLEEKGWFDESYIGIDERGFSKAAFDLIDSVKNSQGKSFQTAGAMDGFVNKKDLAMRVTDLNVGDNAAAEHPEEFADLLRERKEKGLRTTLYSCTEHSPGNFSLSIPAESYWSVINAARMGTAGFLRWAYDAWVEDPLRDTTHNAFEPGDCFLIFPDEKDAQNPESKSSVRLERMAEGIRDVNKLLYLEKEMPSLSEQIQGLYAQLQKTAGISRSYMSQSDKEQLIEEITAFKEGISKLTARYVQSHSEGLHVFEKEKELEQGETWKIPASLVTSLENKTIIYESGDKLIASVDAKGIVTARGLGVTTITLKNRQTGYTNSVKVTVVEKTKKPLVIRNTLTDYKLPEEYLSDVHKGTPEQDNYLGQPDLVMLDDEQTLITVFPVGHGRGRIIMKVSEDAGETWNLKTDIPESWSDSFETPTLYRLDMTDGTTKLILISGRPESFGAPTGGWDTSISTDDGKTWSEFETYCEVFEDGRRNDTVVAMASLVQLKNSEGEYIDKWMGVFHDGSTFVNYKTYLTFDEEGNQQWTTPVPYLSDHRAIESSHQICEVGMFRSPDGKRIVALARSQSHNHPATMFYSDDEGETWSEPADLPGSLAGERHKAMYDPTDATGQRLVVAFREVKYDQNGNNQFDGNGDWLAGDWVAWVGTYDQLMNLEEGMYRILLCEDWAANAKSGDTGYTGLAVQSDGTFIMDSYGHWDKEYSESLHPYNVYADMCWIKQAKFKLSDIDDSLRLPEFKETIENSLQEFPQMKDAVSYTAATWSAYQSAWKAVEGLIGREDVKMAELDQAFAALKEAYYDLCMKGAGNEEDLEDGEKPDLGQQEVANAQKALSEAIVSAAGIKNKGGQDYTPMSWQAFLDAYEKAEAGKASSDSAELQRLQALLLNAQNALEVLKEFEAGGNVYRVTDLAARSVKLIKWKKKAKKVTVNTVAFNGRTYKVTAIGTNAFLKCKTLKSITIGANVKKLEKNAVNECAKLDEVKFKGKKLPAMTKAFRKTHKKMTVRVQKPLRKNAGAKKKTLTKLKRSGLNVSMKKIK